MDIHVRRDGWCETCGGVGAPEFIHEDEGERNHRGPTERLHPVPQTPLPVRASRGAGMSWPEVVAISVFTLAMASVIWAIAWAIAWAMH